MKIIILGAGRIGGTLAVGLARENHDITLIDLREQRLKSVANRADLRTLCGNGAHPVILEWAGIEDADMLVALTESDEINMVACRIARECFNTTRRIARVRSSEYLKSATQDMTEIMSIDLLISPELIAAQHVKRLVDRPGVLQSVELSAGLMELISVRIPPGAPAAGRALGDLYADLPDTQLYIAAISQEQTVLQPDEEVRLKARDEVFILARKDQIGTIMEHIRGRVEPIDHILIAGGGNIGFSIASELERSHQIKLIEYDEQRARYLSTHLEKTLVIQGDAFDERLLNNENIEDMDMFCALTGNEEANVLAAMEARRNGATTTLALVNRASYISLADRAVDITISPQQDTLGELLAYIRRGEVLASHTLRHGNAEVLEIRANETARITEKPCGKLNLPKGVSLGALARDGELIIPNPATRVQPGDRVIMFVFNKRSMRDVEKLFQVSATFLG